MRSPHLVGLVVLTVSAIFSPAPARSQAWVPGPGATTFALNYQYSSISRHLFSQDVTAFFPGEGNAAEVGTIKGQTVQLGVEWVPVRNLGITANAAYSGAAYDGPMPESVLDDGQFHGSFQDASLNLRYAMSWGGFAVTPTLGTGFPLANYDHHGHVAVGRDLSSVQAGVLLGRSLAPRLPSVWLQAGYTHAFVEDVEQWSLDSDSYSVAAGWNMVAPLTVTGYFTYFENEDGIDWYWEDFTAPGVEHNHDRAAHTLLRRVGGSLNYRLDGTKGLFLDVGGVISGANSHDGVNYTLGTYWSLLGPSWGR